MVLTSSMPLLPVPCAVHLEVVFSLVSTSIIIKCIPMWNLIAEHLIGGGALREETLERTCRQPRIGQVSLFSFHKKLYILPNVPTLSPLGFHLGSQFGPTGDLSIVDPIAKIGS